MKFQKTYIHKDINILELILMKIIRYFNKSLYIGDLIYDLENFLNKLETINEQWKKILGLNG